MQGSWSHECLLQNRDSLHLFPGNQSALSLFLVRGVKNAERSAVYEQCPHVWRRMRFPFRESRLPNHKTKGKELPFQNEILRVKVESLDWKWLSHDWLWYANLGHVRQEWAFWLNALMPRFRWRACKRLRGRFLHVSRNLRHIFSCPEVGEFEEPMLSFLLLVKFPKQSVRVRLLHFT